VVYQLVNNGDVPDEDYFNNALMRQTIVKCTSGTRPSSPDEGMTGYETDTNRYISYDGSTWRVINQNGATSYTPVLTANTGNPVLGTGSSVTGRYLLHGGNLCTYWGNINFGTSGVSAGTGQYFVSLPVAASGSTVGPTVGSAVLRDISGSVIQSATSYLFSSATTISLVYGGNVVTNASPWTWAAQDYIAWSLTYETA
jgi:hypothetical protein